MTHYQRSIAEQLDRCGYIGRCDSVDKPRAGRRCHAVEEVGHRAPTHKRPRTYRAAGVAHAWPAEVSDGGQRRKGQSLVCGSAVARWLRSAVPAMLLSRRTGGSDRGLHHVAADSVALGRSAIGDLRSGLQSPIFPARNSGRSRSRPASCGPGRDCVCCARSVAGWIRRGQRRDCPWVRRRRPRSCPLWRRDPSGAPSGSTTIQPLVG